MEDAAQDKQQCSRCEKELDTTGYPRWCKACQAKYRREYNATKKEMHETRGYAAGATAFRWAMAARMRLYGNARFSGLECAALVERFQIEQPEAAAQTP